MKKYDVIIVGAGVAGIYLAKLLNDSKLKVLLVEKKETLKPLSNARFGTFGETVEKFSLEQYVIKKFSTFAFYGPSHRVLASYGNEPFQVVDMNKFAEKLDLNCEIKTGYTVNDIRYKENKILINNELETFLIVDCSGDAQVIANKLGFLKKNAMNMFSNSYELDNCNIPQNKLNEFSFIVDLRYSNIAFWFYPYSKTKCQIGQTDFYSRKMPLVKNQKNSLDLFLKHAEPYKSWFQEAKVLQSVRKTGPTTTLLTLHGDNFLVCGDAAGAGTPLVGEGFRVALEMALSAKEIIMTAFQKNNFSAKILKQHQQNFQVKFGRFYHWSSILRHIILNRFSNKEYDLFIKGLRKISAKQLYDALKSEFNLSIFLKPLNTKIVSGILKHVFIKPPNERITK